MLDLAGYSAKADLGASTIVEPGCGNGEFLVPVVDRLLRSASRNGRDVADLGGAIRGLDTDADAVATSRARVVETLVDAGVASATARKLSNAWVVHDDFLLRDHKNLTARWVVGNPPYVRSGETDPTLHQKYRERWSTMSGRADLYVGFYEAGLTLLEPGGVLCFICADRWMHNQYGAGLRRHVLEGFSLDTLLEVHDVDVFASRVFAYPAITVIRRGDTIPTALATASHDFDETAATRFLEWSEDPESAPLTAASFSAARIAKRFSTDTSWPSGPPERLTLISDLESRYASLSDVGVTVGVGLATGADRVYVTSDEVDVEPDRLASAVGPSDIIGSELIWQGRKIVNPWKDGELVDLAAYPRLRRFFEANEKVLKARYVARAHKSRWWRTLDRPPRDGYRGAKLIVADINDRIDPVLDPAGHWPLHSAYYLTSDTWDLEALGGYLISDVAAAFIEAYSVRMAGGHLRISAQYLRKIRAPRFSDVSVHDRNALVAAFRNHDRKTASRTVRAMLKI